MTEAEAIEAIKQRWEDGWEALHPADPGDPDHVRYVFEGEPEDAPALWARVTINMTVRNQATMGSEGNRRFDARGVIMVELYGDIGQGETPLVLLCDDVRKVFEGRRVGSPAEIVMHSGSSRQSTTNGRWLRRMVTVPFTAYEQR
jgi:hypothetical protein